jgi:hypothetical protein
LRTGRPAVERVGFRVADQGHQTRGQEDPSCVSH